MGMTFTDFIRDHLAASVGAVRPTRLVSMLQLVWQVRRERNQLAALNRDQLADMGIDAGAAGREVGRSLFDLPKSRIDTLR